MSERNFKVIDLDALVGGDEATDEEVLASTVTLRTLPTGTYRAYGDSFEIRQASDDAQYNPGRTGVNFVFLTEGDENKLFVKTSWEPPTQPNRDGDYIDGALNRWGELVRALHMPRASKKEVIQTVAEGAGVQLEVTEVIRELRVGDIQNPDHKKRNIDEFGRDEDDKIYYTIYEADAKLGHREAYAGMGYKLTNQVVGVKAF